MSTNEQPLGELRRNERIDVTEIVHVIDRPTAREIGKLVNISEDGMMILTAEPISEAVIMQLLLRFDSDPGNPVSIGVESLWAHSNNDHSQFWTGFSIIDISAADRARIQQMLG